MNPNRGIRVNTNKWVQEMRLSLHVGPISLYCKSYWVNWPLSLSSLHAIEAILLACSNCFPLSLLWKRGTNLAPKFAGQKSDRVNAIFDLKDTSCPIQALATSSCYKLLLQIASCVRALTSWFSGNQQRRFYSASGLLKAVANVRVSRCLVSLRGLWKSFLVVSWIQSVC